MLTGLEPLVIKAAGPAISRLTGWGTSFASRQIHNRRLRSDLETPTPPSSIDEALYNELTTSQATALISFCNSAELQQIALNIAISLYLTKCSDVKYSRSAIQVQLFELIRLYVNIEQTGINERLADAIFALLESSVISQSREFLHSSNGLPARTRATLIRHAAALATAQTRNSELLHGLKELSKIWEFERDIRSQIASVHKSMRLPHAGISRLVAYDKLFVQPTIKIMDDNNATGKATINNLSKVLNYSLHTVLLGDPGGGKSTASLKLTHDVASGSLKETAYRVPFLVVLKDFAEEYTAKRVSIIEYLDTLCRTPYAVEPPEGAIEYLLRNGSAILILDGLDELLATALRANVVQAVEGFAARFPTTPILVTSRRVGYEEAALDADIFLSASLEGFEKPQVESYARRWFSLDESIPDAQKNGLAENFLADSDYVHDLRANPLMLSLMCGLYSGERYIPKNRPDVYEKCATLLFERWDKQRGIIAPLPFDAHVQSSLRSLALWLYPQQERRKGLPRAEFVEFMTQYLNAKRFDDRDEAESAANGFIDFCRGRAWVLTDVGAELYWFTHQTFLEFFAASQLVRENTAPNKLFLKLWPRIKKAEWDVVAQLAVQTLGKAVEDGADDFIERVTTEGMRLSDNERRNALSFAARALTFIVPKPPVLREIVRCCLDFHIQSDPEYNVVSSRPSVRMPVIELGAASPENMTLIRKYAQERLVEVCRSTEPPNERALALVLYWNSLISERAKNAHSAEEYRFQVDLIRELMPRIEIGAQRHGWVAAYLVEDGKLAVGDLVRVFGLGALYDCVYGGDIIDPPIAWKVIRGLQGEIWPNPKGRIIDRPLVQSVYDALIAAETPWFRYSDAWDAVRGAIRHSERLPTSGSLSDQLMRSTALLLALPLAEVSQAEIEQRRKSGSRKVRSSTRFLPELIDRTDRGFEGDMHEREIDRLRQFDVTPEAFDIARNWIARRISLIQL